MRLRALTALGRGFLEVTTQVAHPTPRCKCSAASFRCRGAGDLALSAFLDQELSDRVRHVDLPSTFYKMRAANHEATLNHHLGIDE